MYELNIVHYCHSLCMPLQSITELPKDDAYKIADKLGSNNAQLSADLRTLKTIILEELKRENGYIRRK